MLNTEDFLKRLSKIQKFYGFSAAALADKIGVQRSGISHLLAGRNKPSLDFVLKLTDAFPEVTIDWLLKGVGSFPEKTHQEASNMHTSPAPLQQESTKKDVEEIIFFYTDGSFKSFKQHPKNPF